MPFKAIKTSFYQYSKQHLLKRFTKRLLKRFTKILAIFSLFRVKSTSDRQKSFLKKKFRPLFHKNPKNFFFKFQNQKNIFSKPLRNIFFKILKNVYLYIRSNYLLKYKQLFIFIYLIGSLIHKFNATPIFLN